MIFDPIPPPKVSGSPKCPAEQFFPGSSVSLLPPPWWLLSSKDAPWVATLLQAKLLSTEDGVSCSCLLTSSNSIPLLSPISPCPSGSPHPVLCPLPRKHPWRASHPALGSGWTTPAHGHPGAAGQCQVIPYSAEAQGLSGPLPLPKYQRGSFAGVPRSPESFRPLPEGLAGAGGRRLDGRGCTHGSHFPVSSPPPPP